MSRLGQREINMSGFGMELLKKAETYVVPVKVQQLYKGYFLRDVSLAETRIPLDFLVTMAELADAIYLTGTTRGQSRDDGPQAKSLKDELGALYLNYMQVKRFDAKTGLV